jgi:tripartite-type tricarboxylate transporter receptor subunit TctC
MTEAIMRAKQSLRFAGIVLACLPLAAGAWPPSTLAQQPYPNRPIKLVVPYSAGGPGDIVARTLTDKLSIKLGQPFVIENRPGANGNIGTDAVAKATPDGYTLGLVVNTTLTANPSLYRKLLFDPEKDIRPIAIVTETGMMLAVHPSEPANSVAEFVTYAKAAAARKEAIAYATAGDGSPGHLAMERFRLYAGFEASPVPYRSVVPMIVDLVAGHVKVAFVPTTSMDHVRAGRLKGLGMSRASRSPLAADVPTIAESGYPDFSAHSYNVVLAPAGIPETTAALLGRELQAALKLPDVVERFRLLDISTVGTVGREVEAQLMADRATWAKIVAAAHMRLD